MSKGNVAKAHSVNVAKADAAQTLNDNLKVVIVQQDETQLASFPDFLAKLFLGKVVIIPSGQDLPQTGVQMTIYFKARTDSETNNIYDEYMYVNNTWEKIGSTTFDAANYYTKSEVNALLAAKGRWKLLGETTLTDNAAVTALSVAPTGADVGFLHQYNKFKIVIEIVPADTTSTVFNPKLYFRRNYSLSGRIYEAPSASYGSLKLQNDNKFYAVFTLEKLSANIMQTTLMPQGNNYTGQNTFFGGQIFGAFTEGVGSIIADDIFFRNFEDTPNISTGSSMKLYAWEE